MNAQPTTRRRQRARTLSKACVALMAFALLGCKPSAEEEAKTAARLKAEAAREEELCRDSVHCGEKAPAGLKVDWTKHALRKWNNHWFLVPRDYDAHFGMKLKWPSKTPHGRDPTKHDPNDWVIQLQIRSHDIPPAPRGYRAIEIAERDGRIVAREAVRPGLDRVRYFGLHPFTQERNNEPSVTYVATTRHSPEGLPPVFGCNTHPQWGKQGGGSAGFMWREGVFVEVLVRKGHVCEDWPELFDEVIRVLSLTQKL